MSASSIPAERAVRYADYLESKTVEPARGDYYLTPEGELTQAPGRWLANPETLGRLGITTGRQVNGEDFIALMEGRHPHTGEWVRAPGAGGARGGGIDLTFSAPKSISVAWALGDEWQRERIETAHAHAVEQTILYLREQIPVVRRRHSRELVTEEHARDVIAAEYRHTTARGVTDALAPDPQLHSHVVITGAIRDDGRVVAVASRPLFRAARELGAFYRSTLAEELTAEGYEIEQHTGKDGRYFEIAGVPRELCETFSERSREVARAAERFRARYGRAPERGELRSLALENRQAKKLSTRGDLERAWKESAARHNFGPEEALQLLAHPALPKSEQTAEEHIENALTKDRAVFQGTELRAVALEQTTGEMPPDMALAITKQMICDRQILTLEEGKMTTLKTRAQEQAIEHRAEQLAKPAGRDVGPGARENAQQEAAERIGNPLSEEQQHALATITGPERAATLIGSAGTGKGVVIDAAARAEQLAGRETIGIAVSGSTAERLGQDSPALHGQTMTLDSLVARAKAGRVHIGPDTTVILDEAGMVDHQRLDALTTLIEQSDAKLIAVGDGQQLPSIGPGGMFDRIATHTPTAQLEAIRRTHDPEERKAWQALRAGEPERAMAHYHQRGQLHLTDTRDQAAEAAVQNWYELTRQYGLREVALIADASNQEIDRLNARAQHIRTERGELAPEEITLQSVHYGLREGDRVAFIKQHRPPNEARVENGTRAEITHLDPEGQATLTLDGSDRQITLAGEDLENLRLAYAQHIYRQQGATVDRAVVITGGWQTSKESSYVEASRARHGTDWHLAREELGTEGNDPDRITRLAQAMTHTRTQTPSIAYQEIPDPADQLNPTPPLHPTHPRPENTPERSR